MPEATPNLTRNHFFAGVVRCPHLHSVGGWLVLLQIDGNDMFSILMASNNGDKQLADSHDLLLKDMPAALARASELCGKPVEKIEWLESLEDARWVQAANLFAHHLKKSREIDRAGLN